MIKIKYIFGIVSICAVLIVNSCSPSGDEDDLRPNRASSIILSVDKQTIDLGETFTFTVKDNFNSVVTSQSIIYFNGNALSGSTYTPLTEGTFSVNSKFGSLSSTSISVIVNASETLSSITINATKNEILLGNSISLSVFGNEGSDLTNEATYFVNGNEITGNTYTPTNRGNAILTATYDTFTSNEIVLFTGHKQKALIEDYTGTWCGYCPRVSYGIEKVLEQTQSVIPVAIHRGSSDPFNYPASDLEDYINLAGYPTAMLNRKTKWNYPEPSNVTQVLNLVGSDENPNIIDEGIRLSSSLTENNLDISVDISILDELFNGKKVVVYILEDGLIYDQVNYTNYYGGNSVIEDFIHDNVLRQVGTDLFGDAILSSEFNNSTNLYSKNFSLDLTSKIKDKSKLNIVAFIINSNGDVLNVQSAKVGEEKDFE